MYKFLGYSIALLLFVPILTFSAPDGFVSKDSIITPVSILQNVLDLIASAFLFGSVILLIYSGYMFFSAEGDTEKIKTARSNLTWSIIGIAVGLLAFAFPAVIKTFIERGVT